MINIDKLVQEIKEDGKYDALLDVVKEKLKTKTPSSQEIRTLVENDAYFIAEYKDLNRWGELSSVHINELEICSTDSDASIEIKKTINKNTTFLKNAEEYEVKQKNVIYLAWTGFIALPSIYVIDNLVRITDMYNNNENSVYLSFVLVIVASIWGFMKVKINHKNQHERYIKTQVQTRELVRVGLENEYFKYEDVYIA